MSEQKQQDKIIRLNEKFAGAYIYDGEWSQIKRITEDDEAIVFHERPVGMADVPDGLWGQAQHHYDGRKKVIVGANEGKE